MGRGKWRQPVERRASWRGRWGSSEVWSPGWKRLEPVERQVRQRQQRLSSGLSDSCGTVMGGRGIPEQGPWHGGTGGQARRPGEWEAYREGMDRKPRAPTEGPYCIFFMEKGTGGSADKPG